MHTHTCTYSREDGRVLGSWVLLLSLGLDLANMQVLDVAASEDYELVRFCPRRNGLGHLPTLRTVRPNCQREKRERAMRFANIHTLSLSK